MQKWSFVLVNQYGHVSENAPLASEIACVAGGISRASAFFSDLMLWSWPPRSEGFGEESS